MSITMTIPDAPTITALATLVAALFTGVVAVINSISQRKNNRNLRADNVAIVTKVAEVHEDTKQTVTNTNGQLSAAHADNRALVETNRLLQDQITKMTPRPSRSTDPVPLVPGPLVPSVAEPDPPRDHP